MKLEMLSGSLKSVAEYLPKLKLKGRENRARQKLLEKVANKFKEFYSDLQELKSDHPDDTEKLNEVFADLSAEKSVLDMTEYAHMMPTLYDALLDYPHEINTETVSESGQKKPSDSAIHDYLIDVLEDGFDDSTNEPQIDEPEAANNEVEEAQYQEVE